MGATRGTGSRPIGLASPDGSGTVYRLLRAGDGSRARAKGAVATARAAIGWAFPGGVGSDLASEALPDDQRGDSLLAEALREIDRRVPECPPDTPARPSRRANES